MSSFSKMIRHLTENNNAPAFFFDKFLTNGECPYSFFCKNHCKGQSCLLHHYNRCRNFDYLKRIVEKHHINYKEYFYDWEKIENQIRGKIEQYTNRRTSVESLAAEYGVKNESLNKLKKLPSVVEYRNYIMQDMRFCKGLHKPFKKDDGKIVDGDFYSNEYIEANEEEFEDLFYCDHCGEWYIGESYTCEGDTICESCYENDTAACGRCGDLYYSDNLVTVGDCSYCDDCLREECVCCESCGEWVHNDDAHYSERHDAWYCDSCYDNLDDSYVRGYHDRPRMLTYGDGGKQDLSHPDGKYFIGFELETDDYEDKTTGVEAIFEFSNNERYCYMNRDGSLSDENGVEIISMPHTLEEHKKRHWDKLFEDVIAAGGRSHDAESSCGLHFHVSRTALSKLGWIKADCFVSRYQSYFIKLAGRHSDWAEYNDVPASSRDLTQKYGKSCGHHYAVNFGNSRTVEFRIFKGTLNYSTFMSRMELVDALVQYIHQEGMSTESLVDGKDHFGDFVEWIGKQGKVYSFIREYIREKLPVFASRLPKKHTKSTK